jgi:hypothetical protein
MNTPSHLIINASLAKRFGQLPITKPAWLVGSVAPDLPLYGLTLGGWIYYHLILGWQTRDALRFMFHDLFFTDPFWISCHNLLHSPTLLLMGLLSVWGLKQRFGVAQPRLFWFLVSCLIHTAIDIPVHVDDGPLLFFPFNWSIRFYGPVSYWDDQHFGREVSLVELILNGALLAYLIIPGVRRWWVKRFPCSDRFS